MSVGVKKVTTQLLDLSIKNNFESVKDGTGKPLAEGEGELSPFGELGSTITNLVNKIKSVVNNILSAIGNVIKSVSKFIGKIMSAIAGAIKAALKYVMGLLGIPLDALSNIAKKVFKYIKSALGVLGGWLKDILGLGSNAGNIKDRAGLAISDIAKTGLLAGLLAYFRNDSRGLKNATNKLLKEFGIEDVTRGYNKLFSHGSYGRDYYDSYYGLNSLYKDSKDAKIYRHLYNSGRSKKGFFSKLKLDTLDSVFERFKFLGLSGATARDLIELSNINDLDRLLPRNKRRINYNSDYTTLSKKKRTEYSNVEKLNIIRKSSGLLKHDEETFDRYTGDGIINDFASRNRIGEAFERRYGIDNGTIFERFTYNGERPNIEKPLNFRNEKYEPSVLADQSKETEIEKIATTLGVENVTLSQPLTYAEHKGFTKEKTVNTKVEKIFKPSKAKELHFTF
jgi:hypothetical protein|nr:MAG TPA: hypothetical protein [Caudoviricetes sp.]